MITTTTLTKYIVTNKYLEFQQEITDNKYIAGELDDTLCKTEEFVSVLIKYYRLQEGNGNKRVKILLTNTGILNCIKTDTGSIISVEQTKTVINTTIKQLKRLLLESKENFSNLLPEKLFNAINESIEDYHKELRIINEYTTLYRKNYM